MSEEKTKFILFLISLTVSFAAAALSAPFNLPFLKRKEKIELAKLGWLAWLFFLVGYGRRQRQGNQPKRKTSSQPERMNQTKDKKLKNEIELSLGGL